ncbi:hypothetical protein [Leptospira levettii]|uniref:Uncharacterized protein n=1 Tax=Leptospira levettii TaxID=2023178 RepID=A0ABY2MM85_9LEPT|nr:hypothetical protein [Leptospira levettii]PKA22636.1 hypothetical protein CH381_29840 [Leptospira sp. mixed culture ATI2-C-A1]TGL69293.1 hypothetical protein EHQ60_12405 [Leptospira levettii]
MNKKIRTSPKSLNEWTLEQNITSELCELFNSSFRFGYPFELLDIFDIQLLNLKNIFSTNRCKTYKLTPIEENKGGGWDTKFQIPPTQKEKRAFFIQFKAGKHSEGNNIPDSKFNTSEKNPNVHVEFTFNDNKGNNQHQTLIDLNLEIEKNFGSKNSVLYGFPRITTLEQFNNLTDKLIFHTTFLTINEIETEAKANSCQLNDKQIHYFRTCYTNENIREVASNTFKMKNNETNKKLLSELIILKMEREFTQLINYIPENLLKKNLYLNLAVYLNILPIKLKEYEFFIQEIDTEIKNFLQNLQEKISEEIKNIFNDDDYLNTNIEFRNSIFNEAFNFFESRQNKLIKFEKLPLPNYTIPIINNIPFEIAIKRNSTTVLIVF